MPQNASPFRDAATGCIETAAHLPAPWQVTLGDLRYDMRPVKAPVISGRLLTIFAWIATSSPLGPLIRRVLLLDNGLTQLRELAAQMPEVPPMYFPMYRMSPDERQAHDRAVAHAKSQSTTVEDLVYFPKHAYFTAASSDVMALHAAYTSSSTTPTAVADKILAALPAIQEARAARSLLRLGLCGAHS